MKIKRTALKGILAFAIVLFVGQFGLKAQFSSIDKKIGNEQYDEAMADLKSLQTNDPKNERIDYRIGKIHFLLENYGAAQAAYQAGVGHGSRFPNNHAGLGGVAVKNKNYDQAKIHFDKALTVDKAKSAGTMLLMAAGYLGWDGGVQEGNEYFKQAEGLLLQVTSKNPKGAAGYTMLGELYDKKGIEELAETYYEKAIGLDANYINGYFRLGQLKKKQKEYTVAANHFKKCLELNSDFAPALKEMAEMWFLAKQYEKGVDYYNQYLAKMGDDKKAKMRLGMFQYLGEAYDEAIKSLEKVKPEMDDPRIVRLLAYSYAKKESPDADKSLAYFKEYFAMAPEKFIIPADYSNKGLALGLKNEDSLSVLEYEKAMALSEERGKPTPEVLMDIAKMYKGKKNYLKQAEYVQRYLDGSSRFRLKETFELGRAYYLGKNYGKADTTFGIMAEKKPDLYLGHLWQARSRTGLDPKSEEGLAKPSYARMMEILEADEAMKAKYKKDYLEACRYMGAYHTLVSKEFETALPFWKSLLEADPEDKGAQEGLKFCESHTGG